MTSAPRCRLTGGPLDEMHMPAQMAHMSWWPDPLPYKGYMEAAGGGVLIVYLLVDRDDDGTYVYRHEPIPPARFSPALRLLRWLAVPLVPLVLLGQRVVGWMDRRRGIAYEM